MKILDIFLSSSKVYREMRKGNWKYVGPKYANYGCWIRNENAYFFEFIWEEENY